MLIVAISGSSCSKGNPTGDDPRTSKPFATTPVVTRTLSLPAGSVLPDSATGLTFRFPAGATGTLSTAAIVSAADAPVAGKGYYVAYEGDQGLSLVFPASHDTTIFVYGYGATSALVGDYTTSAHTWVLVPQRTLADSSLAFDLPMPFGPTAKSGTRPDPSYGGFEYFWVAKITPGTDDDDRLTLYRMEARRMIARYIAELPADRLGPCLSERMPTMPSWPTHRWPQSMPTPFASAAATRPPRRLPGTSPTSQDTICTT